MSVTSVMRVAGCKLCNAREILGDHLINFGQIQSERLALSRGRTAPDKKSEGKRRRVDFRRLVLIW